MTAQLTYFFSAMNAGKSLMLLTKDFSLREKGFKTILMKPAIDTRSDGTIATRLGISEKCHSIKIDQMPSDLVLKSKRNRPDFVFVDEAQFLTKDQVQDLCSLVDNWDINVYCYGLRVDWQGNFFTGSEELFKKADVLTPIETFCKQNKGALAFFHTKHGGRGDAVEIGAEELYDTVSRKVWTEWFNNIEGNK